MIIHYNKTCVALFLSKVLYFCSQAYWEKMPFNNHKHFGLFWSYLSMIWEYMWIASFHPKLCNPKTGSSFIFSRASKIIRQWQVCTNVWSVPASGAPTNRSVLILHLSRRTACFILVQNNFSRTVLFSTCSIHFISNNGFLFSYFITVHYYTTKSDVYVVCSSCSFLIGFSFLLQTSECFQMQYRYSRAAGILTFMSFDSVFKKTCTNYSAYFSRAQLQS